MASSVTLNSTNNSEMKIEYQGTSGVPKTVVVPDSNMTVAGIVDSGTNANGTYIKYEDGTLICRYQYSQTNLACTTASGTAFITANQTWYFPHSFVDGDYSLSIQASTSSQSFTPRTMTAPAGSNIAFALVAPASTTFASVRTFLYAIGRWK